MTPLTNEAGNVYGRLTVLRRADGGGRGHTKWVCLCQEVVTTGVRLRDGRAKSCGCFRRDIGRVRNYRHGGTFDPLYANYHGIKQRCLNPNYKEYRYYGGRGITICQEWAESFEAFRAYMGDKPTPSHSIDRIDNDGNYEPGNVRWATKSEQVKNRRPWTKNKKAS